MRTLIVGLVLALTSISHASDYAVVVSAKTSADAEWGKVVAALKEKHSADVIVYDGTVEESLLKLRKQFPRYVCFVAQPGEAGRDFVQRVHVMTRQFDEDPYTDCFWGIVTGYDAANALRIARHGEPLTIRKTASGTPLALEMCDRGIWYSELRKGEMWTKDSGKAPQTATGPDDTTESLAKTLTEYKADLFVTSGHATERDWQIGYSYRNGQFKSENGVLYGLDTAGKKHPIQSPNPKVFLPIGNCLMGHVDGRDAMALAYMNSGGVNQMIGYTVPTWYGYAGWGCLDYFVEQPGRYTFTEAFFANHQAHLHRMATYFPETVTAATQPGQQARITAPLSDAAKSAGLRQQDAVGLLHDRDVVAFYGDPAWAAKMADGPRAFEQTLTEKDGVYTLEIKPNRGDKSFDTISNNGAQRGRRPFVQFLPTRVKNVQIVEGGDFKPLITDDFILVPHPGKCDPAKSYRVVFKAEKQP